MDFKLYYIPLIIIFLVINLTLGSYVRAIFAGHENNIFSIFYGIQSSFNRYHGMEVTMYMLKDASTYFELIGDFVSYIFQSLIPGFLWSDKPLNPSFLLNENIDPSSAKAISASWLGGSLLLFGWFGLLIGPFFVGFYYAFFSVLFNKIKNTSLLAPIMFTLFLSLHGVIVEGTYFQITMRLFTFIILLLILVFYIMITNNGRIKKPPLNIKKRGTYENIKNRCI